MRYQIAESSYIIAAFAPGHSVTLTIYKLLDSSVVVNAAAMTEIGSTGLFKYQQTLAPSVATEYLWIATDGYDQRAGKIVLGGYPDTLATSQAAEEADIDAIQGDVATIKASQAGEEADIDSIQADQATAAADIATIKASQASEESSIATIDGNVATIQADEATIKGSQTTAAGNIATILSDISSILSSQINEEADIGTILSRAPFAVGSSTYTDTITELDGDPINGAQVEAYSDSDRTTLVDVQEADVNGVFIFHLNPGTYYMRAVKAGYTIPDWSKVVV